MLNSLVHARQSWRHAGGVFALAAAALAVGIGATTAIYTVVNAVMLRPVAYAHGERFGQLFGASIGDANARSSLSYDDAIAYQTETASFDAFGWFRPETYTLIAPGQPQHVQGAAATRSLVESLGVQPAAGRWFSHRDEAVISDGLWKRLGGGPLVGSAIVLNGRSFTVTGIMPPRFRLPEIGHAGDNVLNDVWIPLDATGTAPGSRDGNFFFAYARLKPGVSVAQADADVKRVAADIARREPASHPGYTGRLDSLQELVVSGIRPTLLMLLAAAALLFLVTCANVAALLLARSVARARDTAVRVALGADRRRLAVQFFLEGLYVSVAGGAAGVVLSTILVKAVVTIAADLVPRADQIALDWRVVLFAVATATAASALSSLAPLWQAMRTQAADALSDGVRTTAGARSRRVSGSLVVAEVALAFTLVAVSAALISEVRALERTSAGFDTHGVTTFQLTLPDAVVSDEAARTSHQQRLLAALSAIPGVQAVGFANQTPLDGCCLSTAIYPDGTSIDLRTPQKVAFLPVNPDYFRALGVQLRRGRLLTAGDAHPDVLTTVINEATARHYWGNRDPVGAFGHIGRPDGDRFQVVGIVSDIRNDGIGKATIPEIYLLNSIVPVNPIHVVVRSPLPVASLMPALQRAVQQVDPLQPIHQVRTMDEILVASLALQRVGSFMATFFAFAALLMATLGVYGVVSYSVRQRRVEFGTRMALGAMGHDLLMLVLGGGARLTGYGLGFGAIAVAASAWTLVRHLEVHHLSWLPFASSTGMVAGVALAASLAPAWRVSRFTPMMAIRDDPTGREGSLLDLVRRGIGDLTGAVGNGADAAQGYDSALLTEFVDASRRADSTSEALQLALETLRSRLDAGWALIVQFESSGELQRVAAACADGVAAPSELTSGAFLLNRIAHHSGTLPISAGDLDAWIRWAQERRPEHLPEVAALAAAQARAVVALRGKDQILGMLLLGAPLGREAYSAPERRTLRHSADQLALMLENARLTGRILEQEKLRRDLALAAEVQRRLLPDAPPVRDGVTLAAVTIAARNVAGDYYDFLPLSDGRLALALADVSGKGVPAALIMSVVQASLRIISSDPTLPLPVLAARMNEFIYRSTQSNSYATFFYARLDERTLELEYVNAGHNPPFVVRAADEGATIHELASGGTVLGLFPEASHESGSITLRANDVLLIFTDGVPESMNQAGDEFGEERLKRVLRAGLHLPVGQMADLVSAEVTRWATGAPQHDDLTFVVLKVGERTRDSGLGTGVRART